MSESNHRSWKLQIFAESCRFVVSIHIKIQGNSPKAPGHGQHACRGAGRYVGVDIVQKRTGDPNPQYFLKSTAVQMGGVLPYKWEAYCRVSLSVLQGGVLQGFPLFEA